MATASPLTDSRNISRLSRSLGLKLSEPAERDDTVDKINNSETDRAKRDFMIIFDSPFKQVERLVLWIRMQRLTCRTVNCFQGMLTFYFNAANGSIMTCFMGVVL